MPTAVDEGDFHVEIAKDFNWSLTEMNRTIPALHLRSTKRPRRFWRAEPYNFYPLAILGPSPPVRIFAPDEKMPRRSMDDAGGAEQG